MTYSLFSTKKQFCGRRLLYSSFVRAFQIFFLLSMSPIPSFDHNNVIPPHLGDPRQPNHVSPYQCTTLELSQAFATSNERINILKGLIEFRSRMTSEGIVQGFQWLDGSFLENIEVIKSRPPNDLDLVTFFCGLNDAEQIRIINSFPEFADSDLSKRNYLLDHYPVNYCHHPDRTVEYTRYWIQLFTHNRSRIWKGMLRLELNTPVEDKQALDHLNNKII